MKSQCQGVENMEDSPTIACEDHLFTTFSYNPANKRLTMIPFKYKIKEERRKVLKISVNKLKKIDDPESWLCRSVLINNTMKKLQKETRDEKVNKHLNVASMTYPINCLDKTGEEEDFKCQLNNNNDINKNNNKNCSDIVENESSNVSSGVSIGSNNNGDSGLDRISRSDFVDSLFTSVENRDCFFEKDLPKTDFSGSVNTKSEDFLFPVEEVMDRKEEVVLNKDRDRINSSFSRGVPINEDFVEKIPSIKRCASRKKSLDEDGTANEILNLTDDSELVMDKQNQKRLEAEEVDECDVHDVLSQLYMPPTPRMLTSIDSDTDDDELNVVDIDSSYIDGLKSECQKLPNNEGFFDGSLLLVEDAGTGKRASEDEIEDGIASKRRKTDYMFSCFNSYGESYDNFLCSNKNCESERTNLEERGKDSSRNQEEELIELEDEEDIKRRLSQSLSSHYHRKSEKTCETYFEESCDNQYSCGHTVTMFGDMQSVTFHNLIASLET